MSNLIAEQFYGDIATKGDVIADGTVTGTNITAMQSKLDATTAIFTSELKTTYDGYAGQIQGVENSVEKAKMTLLYSGQWNSSTTLNIPTATQYKYLVFACRNGDTMYSVLFDMSKDWAGGCSPAFDSPYPQAIQGISLSRNGTTFSITHIGYFNGSTVWNSRTVQDSEWGSSYRVETVYGIS